MTLTTENKCRGRKEAGVWERLNRTSPVVDLRERHFSPPPKGPQPVMSSCLLRTGTFHSSYKLHIAEYRTGVKYYC